MTTRPLVILFGGAGRERIIHQLRTDGEQIAALFVPAKPSGRLAVAIDTLRGSGLTITPVTRATLADHLAPHAGTQLLSIGFPYLLHADVLAMFPLPLNVHPTRLPKFRGPTTAAYHILDGANETGSTVHVIDAGMDTGPIVAQSCVPLGPFDTVRSVQRKAYETEPNLVREALATVRAGAVRPRAQDEREASVYARVRTPADSRIDVSLPLRDLYDVIRACDPVDFPAFFEVAGERVCVRFWRPDRPPTDGEDML